MPLCLDSYVLDLHVYLIHEHHQIPYDKPHKLGDDADVRLLLLVPSLKMVVAIELKSYI